MAPTIDSHNLVWIDMEMSGLDPDTDVILEVATIITDKDLNILAEGPVLPIKQKPELFHTMDEWNRTHHTKSGLWQKVVDSEITLEQAENETLAFIESYTEPKTSPLCGNSIAQDRLFIMKYMPLINNHLHYRMIDVSTIKELAKRWYPDAPKSPEKQNKHRALDDIRESIEELRFYRQCLFVEKTGPN
ncbi:oligoribonuclease [Pseudobacteriovorax antillogorgiicola]|uniref:Oligoribonuclease n=1 Tax=Pseudobacteriovorax antillogorgiicola TaxID=1513793 RepID=A0A1Y6B395_9BACT|nr:oligoribonuclease [Pseudobacteriovorax antillogorgiicola]TCS59508.1 oligoribonuclease [Pseudobacteriovorax antillogorgiicola]SME87888.1 oligoribonuclease [Pseudobacteriovorax antillogorgiicola]